MRKIRIAQIGTSLNGHGDGIFKTIKNLTDEFEVVGYALPEGEREKFPDKMKPLEAYQELTVEQIMADPTIEAVAVETEEIYLTKYAQMAADAGKHIHMEKPGSQGLKEFEAMIETVRKNGTVFHTGYMYRYNPMVQELLAEIDRGELGQILSVEAHMSGDQDADLRQWLTAFRGGMMFYLGCHLVDLVYRIQGQPTEVIPCNLATRLDGAEGEDLGMALLKYPQGISIVKTDANQIGGYPLRKLTVTGTQKTVELCPIEMACPGGLTTTRHDLGSRDWFDPGTTRTSDVVHRYRSMLRSFAAMCRGEKENPYTLDYELVLYKLILECCGVKE